MEDGQEICSKNFQQIIKEYESAIEILTSQVEFYAKEQEKLRKEIVTLVSENKRLSKTVSEVLEYQSNLKNVTDDKLNETNLFENLKNQVSLTLQEKDTVVQLWQNAIKTIDHLEEELKLFEGRTHGYFSKTEVTKLKQKYETQIKYLEEELIKCQIKFKERQQNVTERLENKSAELDKAQENHKNALMLIENLKEDIKQHEKQITKITKINNELQTNLKLKHNLIEELKTKDVQAKAKVAEAIQVVEAAFLEKDAALSRETEAKEEVSKLSQTISEIMDDTTESVKQKITDVKHEYSLKLNKAQQTVNKLKEELEAKNAEVEKYLQKYKLLEEQLEEIKKGSLFVKDSNTSKLLILEKNLESTFQKLLLSEKKNLQIMAEKESIKADLDQMANCYENDIKMRETQQKILQRKIKTLEKQLKISNSNLILTREETEKLTSKIKIFDLELKEKLQQKDVKYQELIKAVENKNLKAQHEIEAQLKLHVNLNKKFKKEMKEVIDKFEFHTKELKEVNNFLRNKLFKAVNQTSVNKRKKLYDNR